MVRILGIDPGLRTTGWGVVAAEGHAVSYVACGQVVTEEAAPLAVRLLTLQQAVNEVVTRYQPDTAAIEETFVNKNALSSLKLGHARGALMLTVSLAGVAISEYAATQVKKTITGVGRAEKQQMITMVQHLLPGAEIAGADAADALAVAICHATHAAVGARIEEAVS